MTDFKAYLKYNKEKMKLYRKLLTPLPCFIIISLTTTTPKEYK